MTPVSPAVSCVLFHERRQDRLIEALESVGFSDDVVLVDWSHSVEVEEVGRGAGATVTRTARQDSLGEIRRYAAGVAQRDWVLTLRTDQVVPPQLADAILEMTGAGSCEADCVEVPVERYFRNERLSGSRWGGETRTIACLIRRDRFLNGTDDTRGSTKDGPVGVGGGGFGLRLSRSRMEAVQYYWCADFHQLLGRVVRALKHGEARDGASGLRRLIDTVWAPLKTVGYELICDRAYREGVLGVVLSVAAAVIELGRLWGD